MPATDPTWPTIPEAQLRAIQVIFRNGDAYRALREGVAIREAGGQPVYYRAPHGIIVTDTQGNSQ